MPVEDDPLTALYRKLGRWLVSNYSLYIDGSLYPGYLNEETHLADYPQLFVTEELRKRKQKNTYTYRVDNKQVWSITPEFTSNSFSTPLERKYGFQIFYIPTQLVVHFTENFAI